MGLRLLNHAEQVAAHLREELLRRRWTGELPGADRLGSELDVNHTTMGAAIRILEKEGLLIYQGPGKPRRIVVQDNAAPPSLRVAILLYEKADENVDYIVDLQHLLLDAGHIAGFATKTLLDLKMDTKRVAKYVESFEADAWIVQAGSRPVLEWFAKQDLPAMALAGRRNDVDIAAVGPNKAPAMEQAVQRLVDLGHRRIVMLAREERRKPKPGAVERVFLRALEQNGISTSAYHLPDWEETGEGIVSAVDELYRLTPPTALFLSEAKLYLAVERELARRGYYAPEQVSLICMDPDPRFSWFEPKVAHISWQSRPLVQRMVRWANHVALGKKDIRQSLTKAHLVEGGTIGPAPR